MKPFARSLIAAAGAVLLGLTLVFTGAGQAVAQGMKPLLVEITNTTANPVPVLPIASAAERVQLETFGAPDPTPCTVGAQPVRRLFPDGSIVAPFTVPDGKVLVLTDLSGVVREDVPWGQGLIATLTANMDNGASLSRLSARAQLNADAVASTIMPLSTHLENGVLGGAGTPVCISAAVLFSNGFGIAGVNSAQIQGYLISE
jgi:hypothetical protein